MQQQHGKCGRTRNSVAKPQKDVTLTELSELLAREHGQRFARSSVWRLLDRHGLSFKKNRARRRAGPPGRGGAAAGLVRRAA